MMYLLYFLFPFPFSLATLPTEMYKMTILSLSLFQVNVNSHG